MECSDQRTRRRAARGFTLLEVMAALAIFALVYVTLLRAVAGGLMLEGDAQRRLEASLLADRSLAETIARIREEGVLRPSQDDEAIDIFEVETTIAALDTAALGLDLTPPQPGSESGVRSRVARAPGATSTPSGPSLLTPGRGAGNLALAAVSIVVSWQEGANVQSVRRDTIVFSPEGAAPVLQAIAGAGELPDDAPPGDEDEDEDRP